MITKEEFLKRQERISKDVTADKLSECLMDENVSTYGLFEDIAYMYKHADNYTNDVLVEKMFLYLTGMTLFDFVESCEMDE